jgi:dipeptidyl aminopeptidase/acylaminoacyl peptidase
MSRRSTRAVLALFLGLTAGRGITAQDKQPPTTADFGQWESLAPQPRGASASTPLSPDGRWLAYGINRSNRNNELRVANVATGETMVAPFGEQAVFSADSRWIAYAIALSESEEEKLKKAKKPLHRKMGLRSLASGETVTLDDIEAFAFNASGSRIAMRRYAPEPAESGTGADSSRDKETAKVGGTLIVRDLASGTDTSFGNVGEWSWNNTSDLLAMTISAESKVGNGVQLFDPQAGTLRVLDSASEAYAGLVWRKGADDLVVLRAKSDASREGPTHVALAWTGIRSVREPKIYDPTLAGRLAQDKRLVAGRAPEWLDDGRAVLLSVAPWDEKSASPDDKSEDEPSGVDVWHWRDTVVVPRQKSLLPTTRLEIETAAWHLDDNRLVPLAMNPLEDVRSIKHRPSAALLVDRKAYAMERSIGRVFADVYSVNVSTGARTKVKDRIEDQYVQVSPGGRYVLYLLDDHYWVFDLVSGTQANITKAVATNVVDKQSDETVKQKPAYGVAGWTKDDAAVWIYDRFDIWSIAPDGARATRITDGASEQIRHRYVRLDPDADWIDGSVYLSTFAQWAKKSGYAHLDLSARSAAIERPLWLDRQVSGLTKAKSSDTFAYITQDFDDSPDYFVGGAGLTGARQVSATNAFQSRFAWGRTELVEYKSDRGERLQGVLHYPAGYVAGRKYPMVVYMYERLSDGLHTYASPSERAPYNAAVFTSRGYFFFQPDIAFRPRDPGLSVVECVVPAVKQVIAKGAVDAARVGVVGHSWGGFDASFLATHTDVFAAAVAGAPITDLISNYGNFHWSNGIAETDHIETGQQRMEVPIYEDLQAYIRNSAVFAVHSMKTPLLISVGDADGTVFWHQGLELYNIARRAGKNVVLLAYAGEDHGLRKKANQVDYHHRIQEWFDHYLRGEPAPSWITNGVSVLEREKQLKRKPATVRTTTQPESK